MRKPIFGANWKMHKTIQQAVRTVGELGEEIQNLGEVEVVVFPPFTALSSVKAVIKGSDIALGAQNMHEDDEGAYTGEISSSMLLETGCGYVILGHSERRAYFFETDEIVAKKVSAAIRSGLTPIVCVGETLEERESGVTKEVVERQVKGAFELIGSDEFTGTVIAYEPVWAIGTGKTATSEQAQEVHSFIRKLLAGLFGENISSQTRIQYGGSMKPENAAELLSMEDIDGGLIGGAALDAESFGKIVNKGK